MEDIGVGVISHCHGSEVAASGTPMTGELGDGRYIGNLWLGLIAHVTSSAIECIGPEFKLSHWSFFSCHLLPEQCSPTATLTRYNTTNLFTGSTNK